MTQPVVWVLLKILGLDWLQLILRTQYLRVPKQDPNFGNHPHIYIALSAIWVDIKIMVPFLGTLNIRCRIRRGIQKGTIILITTHIPTTTSLDTSAGLSDHRQRFRSFGHKLPGAPPEHDNWDVRWEFPKIRGTFLGSP